MKLFNEERECCGCNACANICPKGAITMMRNDEGFAYPQVDNDKCVNCNLCEKVCPLKNEVKDTPNNKYFGFKLQDDDKRNKSSSGGVFQAIANKILAEEGVIFAAGFTEDMKVHHLEIDKPKDLIKVQRTKYVQSNLVDTHKKIKQHLNNGKKVLFIGTPCQVHSVKLFLGHEYENLFTISLVCYGVPSPEIWEKYVDYLQTKHKGKLTFYNFRDKRAHDAGHTAAYVVNGKEHSTNIYKDPYCSIFFKKYMIRPSCHECHYTTPLRCSDFTIGDFWGVEKVNPEFDDQMGVSLVIAHTEKAQNLFEEISVDNLTFECEEKYTLQPRLQGPTPPHENRDKFMEHYKKWPFKLFLMWYSKIK